MLLDNKLFQFHACIVLLLVCRIRWTKSRDSNLDGNSQLWDETWNSRGKEDTIILTLHIILDFVSLVMPDTAEKFGRWSYQSDGHRSTEMNLRKWCRCGSHCQSVVSWITRRSVYMTRLMKSRGSASTKHTAQMTNINQVMRKCNKSSYGIT